jgi:hypothetical protein
MGTEEQTVIANREMVRQRLTTAALPVEESFQFNK